MKAGNSLKIFYENCIGYYGEIIDNDIADNIYGKLTYFEISLRMHANNHHLITKGESLEKVIEKIYLHFQLTSVDKALLQNGRQFLNMVKHYKAQFPTWTEGIVSFLKALTVLENNKLTVI